MKKNHIKTLAFYAVLIVGIIVAVSFVFGSHEEEALTYSDVVDYFKNDEVVSFTVDENMFITMKVAKFDENGNKIANSESTVGYQLAGYPLLQSLEKYYLGGEDGVSNKNLTTYDIIPDAETPWWVSYLPFIIIIILVIVFWFFVMNQMNGGKSGGAGGKFANFGKARVKTPDSDAKKVLFSDVAGADEEKAELEEVVEYLKDPTKFSKLGAKIPHGVLLMGPPGTGKTLLAKAVAGEAGVPFFSISGSDFVEMYVGVGASRVRDLFETARKAPASIVFIDEIDAVGRHRGAGLGGGHDEREQTLNQLLVEMDGFGSHEGIIVIAATNRPDILDPALLRPGRFDRQITVNYPDIKGREEILHVHARNKPFEKSVDFAKVAKTTAGFTGADLANLLNEAALLAARRKKSLIGMEDIEDAFIKVIAGPKKKVKNHKESELRKTAYHEAGHAILAHLLPTQDPVQQISIIPSGNALGYTLNPPTEDRYSVYKNELKEKISMLLGGRAAEEIIFGDISGGASNDIQRATDIAKKMVTQLGMSDILGPRSFGTGHSEVFLGKDFSSAQDYSEEVAAKIDSEIHNIITESYNKAKEILRANLDKLHFVSEFLLKHEIMDGEQFKAAMDGEVTFEYLEEMTEAKKRRSREENDERLREEKEKERREKEATERREKENKEPDDNFDHYDRDGSVSNGDEDDVGH
ncbi:MAG: ATP-dependent zinc metalloprotease FtsH [Clostridia bacterium]|nr:ATP-dependent zinc metalloprotease FtsH [Clostridia bacterium]